MLSQMQKQVQIQNKQNLRGSCRPYYIHKKLVSVLERFRYQSSCKQSLPLPEAPSLQFLWQYKLSSQALELVAKLNVFVFWLCKCFNDLVHSMFLQPNLPYVVKASFQSIFLWSRLLLPPVSKKKKFATQVHQRWMVLELQPKLRRNIVSCGPWTKLQTYPINGPTRQKKAQGAKLELFLIFLGLRMAAECYKVQTNLQSPSSTLDSNLGQRPCGHVIGASSIQSHTSSFKRFSYCSHCK